MVGEEIMNAFKPYIEIEKIICNYIFNEDLEGRFVFFILFYFIFIEVNINEFIE